jgi:hypothetical protein
MHSIEEKDELLQRLDKARQDLAVAVAGLSEPQANFKPSSEAWSIANIAEHMATVEDFTILRLQQMISEPDGSNFKDADAVLFNKAADRSAKREAPERVRPTGKPLPISLERLAANHKKMVDLIRSAPEGHFRRHSMPHPVFGPLDGHQWLVFTAGHCTRHTEQIIQTKAAPNFPER